MTKKQNPLLDLSGLPRFSDISPDDVEPAIDTVLADNRSRIEQLVTAGQPFTWDNLVQPLEEMDEHLSRVWSPVSHLHSVRDSEALRDAYNKCLSKLSIYETELAQDERLFRAYKQIANGAEYNALSMAQKKIIDNELRDFRLAGAELSKPDKARFKAIEEELSRLTTRFEENLLDATDAWTLLIVDENEVAGLPATALASARQAAAEGDKEGWLFTLHAPSYMAFMTYADNRNLRQQMYQAYVTRASDQGDNEKWDNSKIMLDILRLRKEQAQLLGFNNYAEYSLATKMARSVDQVMTFLGDLTKRSRPVAEQEIAELEEYARKSDGLGRLESWDVMYYSEKLQQERYAFSQEDARPYFPAEVVMAGMFEVVHRLYGLQIQPVAGVDTWHPDVRFYEIRDAAGEVRGRFYADLYARNHKRGGAWMDECIQRMRTREGVQTPVAYLTCNFAAPVGETPSLLTHDEVITLFHEFGHGLHHMLTKVDYVGVSGINGVAWDAVELPSQFMENWCWERQAVGLFSRHFQTGEPLPGELFGKMHTARNFHSALQMVRQLEFALFDMKLHSEFDPDGRQSIQDVLDEVRRQVAVMIPPGYNRFQHAFSHIFAGGYAAGYYSYKWAEVLSADAFSKFEENGVFDHQTGMEFMQKILEQGGAREPMELFVDFRGREPKIDALLRHSGLSR